MPPLRFKPSGKYPIPSKSRPGHKPKSKSKTPQNEEPKPKSKTSQNEEPSAEVNSHAIDLNDNPRTALDKTGKWIKNNWGKVATGGLFAWMMLDDGSDEKIGGAFGKIGEVLSGAFGGLLSGLMPLLISSSSLACVVFMFVSMFAAIQSQ